MDGKMRHCQPTMLEHAGTDENGESFANKSNKGQKPTTKSTKTSGV